MSERARLLPLALVAAALLGCNGEGGQVDDFGGTGVLVVPARRGTVVMAGCALDSRQSASLASPAMKKLVTDVIFLCFALDAAGAVQPSDAPSRAAFAAALTSVEGLGYHAKAGASLGGGTPAPGKTTIDSPLDSATLRATILSNLVEVAGYGDGIEIDLRRVPDAARADVTTLVTEIASVVRPARTVGVIVPATAPDPSGLPPGVAVDLATFASKIDRVRVMTLDYSLAAGDGPTIDSGWAVDSARRAIYASGKTPVDVSMPLYGWHFTEVGAERVTYEEALVLANGDGASIQRAPGGAPFFSDANALGYVDTVWFDDAPSTVLTLAAWSTPVLPAAVGVVFYGLGSEDPSVWNAIVEATP